MSSAQNIFVGQPSYGESSVAICKYLHFAFNKNKLVFESCFQFLSVIILENRKPTALVDFSYSLHLIFASISLAGFTGHGRDAFLFPSCDHRLPPQVSTFARSNRWSSLCPRLSLPRLLHSTGTAVYLLLSCDFRRKWTHSSHRQHHGRPLLPAKARAG